MYFGDVSKEAYLKIKESEGVSRKEAFKEFRSHKNSIEKVFRGYFNDMIEVLNVKDTISCMIKGGKYEFGLLGMAKLSDLFYHIDSFLKQNKKPDAKKRGKNSQKNYLKRVIFDDNYNSFVSSDDLEQFMRLIDVNTIVIKMLECFYLLFVEAGLPDKDVEGLMTYAFDKLRYNERVSYNQTHKVLLDYLNKLTFINEKHSVSRQITHTENTIWCDYAAKQIENTMREVLAVRMIMDDVRADEHFRSVLMSYSNAFAEDDGSLTPQVGIEQQIYMECQVDERIQYLMDEYNKVTEDVFDLPSFVVKALIYNSVEDNLKRDYLFEDLIGIPANGRAVRIEYRIRRKKEIVKEFLKRVAEIGEAAGWSITNVDDDTHISRNSDLLKSAIERLNMKREMYIESTNKRLEELCKKK